MRLRADLPRCWWEFGLFWGRDQGIRPALARETLAEHAEEGKEWRTLRGPERSKSLDQQTPLRRGTAWGRVKLGLIAIAYDMTTNGDKQEVSWEINVIVREQDFLIRSE